MNATGQAIVTQSLTLLGIAEQGGGPNVSDSNVALITLNSWWESMSIDEGLIYAVQRQDFALTAAQGAYSIGPGANVPFNIPLPSRIYKAFIVTGTQQNELDVVSADRYYNHNDLTATSTTPDELYPDFNIDPVIGRGTLFLYPVPSGAPLLRLIFAATFALWSLATVYDLPPGYFELLTWGLAFKSISAFGVVVQQQIAQMVTANGKMAEDKIRAMNAKNRQLQQTAVESPTQQLQPQAAAVK
jgi:hypothetical protein